jgi:SAM-dependent methyltransferase
MGVCALERGAALHDEAFGLSVGAGHEPVIFYLTNRCRWLFATDIYGTGGFDEAEAAASMLIDPDLYAPYPYRRRRLTVAHMDALDLRFEDGTFDFVVSFGSIEHFGGRPQAAGAMAEISRVLKPGGIAFVTTEMAVDGGGDARSPNLEIFSPETLVGLGEQTPGLGWFDGVDLSVPDEPDVPTIDLVSEASRLEAGDETYPHLRLGLDTMSDGGRTFPSASRALKADGGRR